MRLVLDTSILIDCLRGNDKALAALEGAVATQKEIYCSEISRAEVFAGMWPEEEERTRVFLSSFLWYEVNAQVSEQAGALAFANRNTINKTNLEDYIIAATAKKLDGVLWTLNIKDFPMFPELERPY